ncbi:DUF2635 domain-containing protein [Pseudomonas putida]|uniref:DUF2635 domain-containing protein n=1 Tax=Pseudomonas TaxID=286 RepID=UPI0018E677F8|nr:DUF2635 domain-containing protein [Pseudomonas putida]MBI6944204.1 DUF2635 domain-containing protein [Pseudomonas putida]MBI6960305.1 DUF2635 domain-containing protein [Pseudomonas putida]
MPVKLYPAPGLKIRDPAKGDYLPEEGRTVELDIFWRRRLRDQEVTETAPAKSAAAASTTKEAAKTAAPATTEGA